MLRDNIKNVNYGFIIIPLVLSIIGLIFVYSAGIKPDGTNTGQFIKQLIWVLAGIGIAVFILSIDYYQLVETAEILYIIGIISLIITLVFGKTIRSSRSWLGFAGLGIQPSELMKILYIVFFAKYLANAPVMEKKLQVFAISFGIVLAPMALILLQPDLGTSIVFMVIFIVMSFMGMPDDRFIRYLVITIGVTGMIVLANAYYQFYYLEGGGAHIEILDIAFSFNVLIIIAIVFFVYTIIAIGIEFFNPIDITRKILPYAIIGGSSFLISAVALKILKPYQWKRLLVFLNPEFDKLGAGYNLIQSKIAIGSGGFFGKGIFRGTQNILGFLPEKGTDFIFSIIGEEVGFFGGGLVLILFAVYFYYNIKTITSAKDREGMLIASGILAMFFTHFIINTGMALGTAPITGLPLPFVSYGGSSYLVFIIASALLLNIYSRRFVH